MEIAAIRERWNEQGFTGSYSAVRRFVRQVKPLTPKATVRVARKPGEEGQVDFGYAGKMLDPETGALRRTWVFVMTLSWIRHQYAEFVFDQQIAACAEAVQPIAIEPVKVRTVRGRGVFETSLLGGSKS